MLTTCANTGRKASNIKGGSAATRHVEDAGAQVVVERSGCAAVLVEEGRALRLQIK